MGARVIARIGMVSTVWLILLVSSWGDVIVLKDGRSRTGTVVEERDTFIIFDDPSAGKMQLEKSSISQIQRSQPGATATVPNDVLAGHRTAGRFKEAFDAILQSHEANPQDSALPGEFQKTVFELLEKARNEKLTKPDQARQKYTVLYTALIGAQKKTGLMGGDANFKKVVDQTIEELTQHDLAYLQRIQNQPALKNVTKQLAEEVVVLNPSNLNYQMSLANIALEQADWKTAQSSFLAVANSPKATLTQKQSANDGLARVESGSQGQFPRPKAAATTPTPVPTVIAAPVGTPALPVAAAPTPAPPAAPGPPEGPKWKQVLWQIQHAAFWSKFSDIPALLTDPTVMPFLIGIPIAIIVLWVIPFQFFKFRANRGDVNAAEFLFPSKKYGIAMLVPYVTRILKQPKSKNRCPFCNKPIDNIDSYSDFNFLACPHCSEPISPVYDPKDYINHLIHQIQTTQKRAKKGRSGDIQVEKDAMLKLVRAVITMVVRKRASDLHMETEQEGGKIRARIDGIMYELLVLPRDMAFSFISALKVMANLDITERRVPQDGKISMWIDKQDYDLRINTSPASMGEKVVIRVLNQRAINVDPTKLGLEADNLEKYQRAIHKPHGLVIVTGPSGSGKSTTLYVALNELNTGDKNMVTIEDPIEYQLKGLSQMQVNPAANFTFANGLRSILRQDPDVIMVGEIRDKETAEAALEAAMTGHLVLTTLHTIDAPSAFSRMSDLGIETRRIASAVNCVIAQRLARTICTDCKQPYKPKKQDLDLLNLSNVTDITYVRGAGCETCMNTGYFGRMALFEILIPDDSLKEILEGGASVQVIKEIARKSGYRTLRDEGLLKVRQGLTTVEEVLRVTSE